MGVGEGSGHNSKKSTRIFNYSFLDKNFEKNKILQCSLCAGCTAQEPLNRAQYQDIAQVRLVGTHGKQGPC